MTHICESSVRYDLDIRLISLQMISFFIELMTDLLGITVLQSLHRDGVLVLFAKSIRLFSFGFLAVILLGTISCGAWI